MMSTPTSETPTPVAVPPVRPWYKNRHLVGYSVTAVVAMIIGGGIGNAAVAEKPAKVVTTIKTVDVPGPTTTVTSPPITETVNVPGPTITKTITVTEPAPAPAVAMAGDGTYQVGVDVKPGTYVSSAPSSNCYWARMRAGDGIDNIIANNNSSGQSVVTIKSTDKFFQSSGCSDWTKR
jgi:hypothetical protein